MQNSETIKYVIHANITAEGVVERPDVVGAIFGQTEGLLGEELDLRDLQKTGRIGRIEVQIESKGGKSRGKIMIPSSLDKVETAIIAAALETIDRVGPCVAHISVEKIEDVRSTKRKQIIERAKVILRNMFSEGVPESDEIIEEVKQAIRVEEVCQYGKEKLPAGPNIDDSDAIIVVEGRADVLNLLKYGIKNVIAVEGTNIPETVVELSKRKIVTAFLDGDRGGDLILKELLQRAEVDYVARAPEGRGVEELTYKEIVKALRNKVPVEQISEARKVRRRDLRTEESAEREVERSGERKSLKEHMEEISGTLIARLLREDNSVLKEVPVRDLANTLSEGNSREVCGVVFDGIITQRLVDIASEKGLKFLAGVKKGNLMRVPANLKIMTADELEETGGES
ncbi:MAG: primase [Archaeoglobi archaeon]|nr:primase [Archaeoglobi archaeon]MDK2781098.1 primase [Archaeoglobi archaeon]